MRLAPSLAPEPGQAPAPLPFHITARTQLRHATNKLSTGAIILDNTDSAVTYTGTWSASTTFPNYYGTNYRQISPNTPVSGG